VPPPLCHSDRQCEYPCPSIHNNLQHAIYLSFRTWMWVERLGRLLVPWPFEFICNGLHNCQKSTRYTFMHAQRRLN
jgi:hypothetical protein